MNDIRPRRKPQQPTNRPQFQPRRALNPQQPTRPQALQQPAPASQPQQATLAPESSVQPSTPPVKRTTKKRSWIKWVIIGLIALIVLAIASMSVWYTRAQRPVEVGVAEKINITIEPGMTPTQIASHLKANNLIRSELAFDVYTRIHGVGGALQAGDYRLAPTESLGGIVEQLQQGQSAEFTITFYPGATLYDPTDIADNKRTDVYTMLQRAGYKDAEIRAALEKDYNHPVFATKPKNASIEGYVYGDTYRFATGASVEDVLTRTFDEFHKQITEKDIVAKLKKHKMTLYEGITLASIIEREVSGRFEDQKQVSQIFHLRLDEGMSLGADATFMYAAQQQNKEPTSTFDSPYNTRQNAGLPPGPISSPHIEALEAAANPAPGDYIYFVSGDDGTTHFAKTLAEHEENTRKYCTDLCYAIE